MKKILKTEAIETEGGERTMKKEKEIGNWKLEIGNSPLPRFFLSTVIALALCVVGVSIAWAFLGINLTGDPSWTLANISPESINESTTTWTVENIGSEAEDVSISVANSTNWQVAAAPDVDKFVLDHNAYFPGTPWKNITNSGVSLKDNLPALETKNFKLQFTAPKSGSDASQTITVTLTANNQWYSGPIATDVAPNQGINTGSVSDVVIDGENFDNNATVRLLKDGQTPIDGTSVTVTQGTPDTLEADFDITGAEGGSWTIAVTNPDTGDTSPPKDESGTDCFFGVIPDTWSGACIWKEGDIAECPVGYPNRFVRTSSSDINCECVGGTATARCYTRDILGCTISCDGIPCSTARCQLEPPQYPDRVGASCSATAQTATNVGTETFTYCCQ